MSQSVRKRLIQKIRNRMSAQRSRIKQKLHYRNMENQVQRLRAEINALNIKCQQMGQHNGSLEMRLQEFEELCNCRLTGKIETSVDTE